MKFISNLSQISSNNGYACSVCGRTKLMKKLLNSDFCPFCLKKTSNNVTVQVEDTVTIKESGKILRYAKSKSKFLSENIFGWFSSYKYRDGVNKIRIEDREKDYYKEQLRDPITGKILEECEEPLSKHQGHGSAKKS